MRTTIRTVIYWLITRFPRVAAWFAWPVLMIALETLAAAALCYKAKGRTDVYEGIVRYLEEVT